MIYIYILGGVGMTSHHDNQAFERPIISINITSHAEIVKSVLVSNIIQ